MTSPASGVPAKLLRRDRAAGWLGGVCAGIARHLGADVTLVRIVFVVAAAAGGLGFAAYALAWLLIPAGSGPQGGGRLPTGRGAVQVALGVALLLLSAMLMARALGLWLSDAIIWPLLLIAGGG